MSRSARVARRWMRPAAMLALLAGVGCLADPVIGPSGRVVFQLLLVAGPDDGPSTDWETIDKDIYRLTVDGDEPENLTRFPTRLYGSLSLSPNGQRVLFSSDREGCESIFSMNVNGTDLQNLTPGDIAEVQCNYRPRWSPDGEKIAFVSTRSGFADVWVMNADGSAPVNVSQAIPSGTERSALAADAPVSWTPDGEVVIHRSGEGGGVSYVVGADGIGADYVFGRRGDLTPFWSPNGTRVAFIRRTDGGRANLWVANADGSDPVRFTDQAGNDELTALDYFENVHSPWSRNGPWIAFTNRTNAATVYVIDATGDRQERLTQVDAPSVFNGWAHDGRVTLTTVRNGNADLYLVSTDGFYSVNLTNSPAQERYALWLPLQ
jgi:Tol biopolymer transport system component